MDDRSVTSFRKPKNYLEFQSLKLFDLLKKAANFTG